MSNTTVTIRLASSGDARSAHRLIEQLGYPELDPDDFRLVFESVLSRSDMIVLVAENESGSLIGLESVSIRPQIRLAGLLVTIDELVVADIARGTGIGKRLLREAKTLARHLGDHSNLPVRLQLETNRSRESYRRRFYLKNGFEEANSAIMRLSR